MITLPILLKVSKKPSNFFTVDIGTNSVKCVAFEILESEGGVVANIVGVGKGLLTVNSLYNGLSSNPDVIKESLAKALNQASEGVAKPIEDAVFGVSGDESFGLMTTVRVNRAKDYKITEKELKKIYGKIREVAYSQVLGEVLERTGESDLDIELVTSSVVYTKIDDKFVANPVGMQATKMEIALFTAFSPAGYVKNIQKLSRSLGLRVMAIGSEMFSLVKSLKLVKEGLSDLVVMDIGGEVTDVGIVFGGGIVSKRSLTIGGNHFTRHMADELKIAYDDAENKKKDYSFGKLSDEDATSLQDTLNPILEIWLSGVELLFMDFTGVKTFPSKVYLVGGGSQLPDVAEYIGEEPWTRSIPFKSPPEFSKISLKDLSRVVDTTGKAQDIEFVLPASLSIIYLEMKGYF